MSNKRVSLSFSLSFSIGDLPMIAHAFAIARASAMMRGNKIAMNRLDEYHKIIESLIPETCKIFDFEEWAEICICIQTCNEWEMGITNLSYNLALKKLTGRIEVRIDQRKWESSFWHRNKEGFTETSDEFIAVKSLLEEISGLDSKQVVNEKTEAR